MRSFPHGLGIGARALGAFLFLAAAGCGDDSEEDGSGGGSSTTSSTAQGSTGTTVTTGTTSSSTSGEGGSGSGTGGGGAGDGTGGGTGGATGGTGGGTGGDSGGTGGGTGGTGGGTGGDTGSGGEGGGEPAWAAPKCDTVDEAAFTFSRDDGDTLTPRSEAMSGVAYTAGIAALDVPNVLLVANDGMLLRSEDAGCKFTEVGAISGAYTRIVAGVGDRAFVYQEGDVNLFRVDGETITTLRSPGQPGIDGIVGVGVDPNDPDHVRVALYDGTLWDSTDAGGQFDPIGTVPEDGCFYQVAFDAQDIDHLLCATFTTGTWLSVDGGASWDRSELDVLYANAFRVEFSRVDPNIAWIEGLENDLHEGEPVGNNIRHIWYSNDGGATFESVILENDELEEGDGGPAQLFNGNFLAPHPKNPDILYFTFGIPPIQGPNVAELYKLDVSTDTFGVERQSGGDIDDYTAIGFNPGADDVIYFALSSERGG